MSLAIIALGSNLGSSVRTILCAISELAMHCRICRCSSLYRTAPEGYAPQRDFINAVLSAETELRPYALLDLLHELEERHHRRRLIKNGPRTLDLDLICYDQLQLHDPCLTLPHPRMHERAFVLVPLQEIAPELMIPGLQRSVSELCAMLDKQSRAEAIQLYA